MGEYRKWVYVIAGSGLAVGIVNYIRELRSVQASWSASSTPSVKWDSNWDRREFLPSDNIIDSKKNEAVPTATRHLIFVRHGQFNFIPIKDSERTLTTLGQNQAELTGLRLKELNFPYTRMVQSTLTRAMETATIIHKHLPHLPLDSCSLLCEGIPSAPEPPVNHGKTEATIYKDGKRIEAAFRKYFHRADPSQKSDSYEIFVCHANVIRYFVCRALQFPPESWLRFSLFNGSLTWIMIRPNGRVTAFCIGDCGHFPPEMITKRSNL